MDHSLEPIVHGTTRVHNPSKFDFDISRARATLPSQPSRERPQFSTFALTEDTAAGAEAISAYQRIRPLILSILHDAFPDAASKWALTAVGRGLPHAAWSTGARELRTTITPATEGPFTATIYIVCEEPTRLDNQLGEIKNQRLTSLRIEVTMGSVELFGSSVGEYGCPWYEEVVNMGRSIGPLVTGQQISGTFGGYLVEVETGQILGLTAGHVCLAGAGIDREKSDIQLTQPSLGDHSRALEEASTKLRISSEISVMYGYARQFEENVRARDASALTRLERISDKLHFGNVLFANMAVCNLDNLSCECGSITQRLVWKDYALVEVSPERRGHNRYGFINIQGEAAGFEGIAGHTEIFPGQEVRKSYTRSTYPASGVVNGVCMDIQLPSNSREAIPVTQEWIIVGNNGPMSQQGDSGSLVVDEMRRVVGMIIGGVAKIGFETILASTVDNITVLTPASNLLEWIKKDTGLDCRFYDA